MEQNFLRGKKVAKPKIVKFNRMNDYVLCSKCEESPCICKSWDIPMGVSEWRKHGQDYGYWEYFEKEIKESIAKKVVNVKEEVRKLHGTFKYDDCYDDVLKLLK